MILRGRGESCLGFSAFDIQVGAVVMESYVTDKVVREARAFVGLRIQGVKVIVPLYRYAGDIKPFRVL